MNPVPNTMTAVLLTGHGGVENAQPGILISYKFFHITATGGPRSEVGSPTKLTILTTLEKLPGFTEYFI